MPPFTLTKAAAVSVSARDSRSVHCLYICQPVTATVPSWSPSVPPWVTLLVQGICQCLLMVRSPSCVCLCVTVMGLLCLPVTFRPLDWPIEDALSSRGLSG